MKVIKIPKGKDNFLWRLLGFVEKTLNRKYEIIDIGAMLGMIFFASGTFPFLSFLIDDPFIVVVFATIIGFYIAWVARENLKTLKYISKEKKDKYITKFPQILGGIKEKES